MSQEQAVAGAAGVAPPAIAVVFTGGDAPDPRHRDLLSAAAFVVAADSGLEHALALGIPVDVVVGDLDSVTPEALARAESSGTRVERHPTDKDATDLALALDVARASGARRVLVAGGAGGRVDHFLANLLLLGAPEYDAVEIVGLVGPARVTVVNADAELTGTPGSLVSLLPVGGPATGVRTTGLRWALRGETLLPGSSRGVSNELVHPTATVSRERGTLLAVQPTGGRS